VPARPAPPPEAAAASPPAPERREPAPGRSGEADDAAIRRIVATYARAIENKDLQLFRSVKPNMSAEEQRRIEEGFRAVYVAAGERRHPVARTAWAGGVGADPAA
jgi:hypothetical protein